MAYIHMNRLLASLYLMTNVETTFLLLRDAIPAEHRLIKSGEQLFFNAEMNCCRFLVIQHIHSVHKQAIQL